MLTQSNESTFCSPDIEFDHQVDTHYSLKPDFKYYETHEFHNLKDKIKNTFSLLHTNIQSLQYNGDNLKLLLANLEFKFDIIAVTETWNPEYSSHSFNPPILNGYNNYSGNTGSTLKGECGLYINKDLKSLERKDLYVKVKENDCEMETFWIEIVLGKQPNRLIVVIYRHPTKIIDLKTTEILNSTLQKIKKENKKTLLTVDFNFDLLIHDKNEAISSFLNMTLQNNSQPCITEPILLIIFFRTLLNTP